MLNQIKDYLQTQALKLNVDEIAMSCIATQAVLRNGQAHLETEAWQYPELPERLQKNAALFQSSFMALDAVFSRQSVQSATIYAYLPDESHLCRIAQFGQAHTTIVPVNDETAQSQWAARTALSGWANVVDSAAQWQDGADTPAGQRAAYEVSLPIAGEDGVIYGVLDITAAMALSEEALAEWVGLALGVLPILREALLDEVDPTD